MDLKPDIVVLTAKASIKKFLIYDIINVLNLRGSYVFILYR